MINFLRFFFQKRFIGLGLTLSVFLIFFFLFFLFLYKIEIKLLLRPYKIEKNFEFIASLTAKAIDFEKRIIPLMQESVSFTLSQTSSVKGTKIIGDKAKGEIVIYNGTEKPRTFAKGTLFKSPQNLEFVTTEEITVPSKITDLNVSPPIEKWGEAKVSAEAKSIGAEYNIPAGTTLSLSSNATTSSFLAKSAVDFIGGTSRQVQAVSKEDIQSLSQELLSKAINQAKETFIKKLSPSNYLLEDSFFLKNKNEKFNKEIGDETAEISLNADYVFVCSFFSKSDWDLLVEKIIFIDFPPDYEKTPVFQEKNFSLIKKEEKENKYIYSAQVKSQFFPQIKIEDIKNNLKGRTFHRGKKYLNSLQSITGFDVIVKPEWVSFLKIFPLRKDNITIQLEAI